MQETERSGTCEGAAYGRAPKQPVRVRVSLKFMDFGLVVMADQPGMPLRSDGGVTIPERPPRDVLSEETLQPDLLAESGPGLETLVQLLNQPALTRVYVYVCYWGPTSPPEVTDDLDLSKSTAYEYIDRLVDLGLVERDDSTRPQQLTAEPVILVEQYVPIIVTPTVLHAFALQEIDEDVQYFVDRHGLGKLVAALRGAGLHYADRMTQRMVAGEIDVRDSEAMMIIYALVPALAVGWNHDPYFEYLFPDVHDQMELPDLDDQETSPAQPTADG